MWACVRIRGIKQRACTCTRAFVRVINRQESRGFDDREGKEARTDSERGLGKLGVTRPEDTTSGHQPGKVVRGSLCFSGNSCVSRVSLGRPLAIVSAGVQSCLIVHRRWYPTRSVSFCYRIIVSLENPRATFASLVFGIDKSTESFSVGRGQAKVPRTIRPTRPKLWPAPFRCAHYELISCFLSKFPREGRGASSRPAATTAAFASRGSRESSFSSATNRFGGVLSQPERENNRDILLIVTCVCFWLRYSLAAASSDKRLVCRPSKTQTSIFEDRKIDKPVPIWKKKNGPRDGSERKREGARLERNAIEQRASAGRRRCYYFRALSYNAKREKSRLIPTVIRPLNFSSWHSSAFTSCATFARWYKYKASAVARPSRAERRDATTREKRGINFRGKKKERGKKRQKKEMLADKEDYSFPRFMSKPFYMWSIVCWPKRQQRLGQSQSSPHILSLAL